QTGIAPTVVRNWRGLERKNRLARQSQPAVFSPNFSEREKGFDPSTSTLARWHSTAELLPRKSRRFTSRRRTCQARGPVSRDFWPILQGDLLRFLTGLAFQRRRSP